jgi:hypothetical protein
MTEYIDIVFNGPPGPQAPQFVEVENEQGASIRVGTWIDRDDGYWALRLTPATMEYSARERAVLRVALKRYHGRDTTTGVVAGLLDRLGDS